MNLKKISLAVSAVMACTLAGTAAALPIAQYNATPGDTLDVFVSGASAQDGALERLFRNTCDANTLDIYRSGSNQRVMFCRISSTGVPGFPAAGQKVAFHKTSEGGSGNGVQPVSNQTQLGFINMAAIKSGAITCGATTSVPAETPVPGVTFAAYTNHENCNGTLRQSVPDAGISDVEPKLVGASAAETSRLTVQSQNAVVWGVPVTIALRNALQQVQGLAVGSDSAANMPSLTRNEIASIYNGGITDWGQMTNASGAGLPAAAGVTPPANSQVYLCRRVPTSGTQASFEVHFLGARCTAGVLPMLSGNDGGVVGAGTVNEGSGTGNVRACLRDHNAANRWAVGLFSTENVENLVDPASSSYGWRFIKINGYAPTLKNVADGNYDFFSEQSIQWRNASSGNALAGLRLSLMQDVANNAGSPTIIRALNAGFTHVWGDGGVMALITNGHVPTTPPTTDANVAANPVLTSTKSPQGFPNNCQVPVTFFPVNASSQF